MTPSPSPKSDTLFLYGMLASMFCWGLSWASGKVIAGYGDATSVALCRTLTSFIALLILLAVIKMPLTLRLKGLPMLLGAALTLSLYNVLFLKGLFIGKAGAGGVLVTTLNPIISYVIALLVTRRRPTIKEFVGLLLGLIAGCVLLQVWNHWEDIFKSGNLYFVGCSLTWAILSLFTSKSSNYGSPVSFSLWIYGLSSVVMVLFTTNSNNLALLNNSDALFWVNMLFGSVITTALATTFYFVATARLGASKASSFIFLVPVAAALGSWIFLKEVPQWYTLVGGVLGIGAVYILNAKKRSTFVKFAAD
jgi:drug/metabolite transporter (DMT)-like permease